jgi:hypothetical protein
MDCPQYKECRLAYVSASGMPFVISEAEAAGIRTTTSSAANSWLLSNYAGCSRALRRYSFGARLWSSRSASAAQNGPYSITLR